MSTLDDYVRSSRPRPQPIVTSRSIQERTSTFVGTIFHASTVSDARRATTYLKDVTHGAKPATCEISAWRCMVLKPAKTGLGGPEDFELVSGFDDDHESYAGSKVLKVMEAEGILDAVVVVSRWYGGDMIGPVRFEHIQTCAREVCRAFRLQDDLEDGIATLSSLDAILDTLRSELAGLMSSPPSEENAKVKTPDYGALRSARDMTRVKRLISAREKSIKSVKLSIEKAKQKQT